LTRFYTHLIIALKNIVFILSHSAAALALSSSSAAAATLVSRGNTPLWEISGVAQSKTWTVNKN
jgi:hypothetical protein